MNNLHLLDIAIIGAYLVLCLIIGLYKIGNIKTIRDYTLGPGKISTLVLLFTIFATHMGAGATVGTVENLHSMGLIFAIALMFSPLFWVVTARICANNITVFKEAGCISVSDIMEHLYGKTGKWITNIFSILLSIGILALQIGAIGYLFNYFLGVSHAVGVIIGFGTIIIYSLFGGLRSVALTDMFQGIIIVVAISAACLIALYDVGGYKGLVKGLPASHLSVDFTKENILLLASMIFYILTPEASGTFIQRFLMANNQAQLNRALKIITISSIPFTLIICLIGFIVKVKAPNVNPNVALFYLNLPVGVTGLLVTGILAAIMSTADSWLNTTSILCAHDVGKGLFPRITDRQELFIARISVLCIGAFAALLALTGTSLMALEWLAGNFWLPVIFVPLAAGLLKFRTSHGSFIGSIIGGIAGVLIGRYISGAFATISLLFGAMSSALGLFGMHFLQKLLGGVESMPRIKLLWKSTGISFLQQGQKYQEYCYIFGGIGIVYFLSSSFFMPITVTKVLYIAAYLKAVAAILCLGLCMHTTHLNTKQQAKYMPWYWCIMLLYCLPFLSSYIALTYDYDLPWSINLVLSFAILYLVSNWSVAFILSAIGFLAGYILFKATGYSLAVNDLAGHSRISSYIYCFLTGIILLTLQQKDRFKPLDSSSIETNEAPGVLVGNICSSIADIKKAVDKGLYGIGECVQEALGEYGFKGHERMRIRVDMVGRNFQFKGSKFFVKQIIMNLIDNSLKHAGSNATINIWSEGRTLTIKDNGKGIDSEVLNHDIFSASSIGLSFCKRAMEAMGGKIRCESGPDKGTKFELTFPKLS